MEDQELLDPVAEETIRNQAIVQWDIPEYHKYQHGRMWYIVVTLVALAAVGYAVYADNYVLAVLTVLLVVIIAMHEMREPKTIQFGLTPHGLFLDERVVPYTRLSRFWVVGGEEEDAPAFLYFDFRGALRPRFAVPITADAIDDVREVLSEFVPEDETEDYHIPFTDRFSRWIGI
jgi:hypothetical protein